jgi:hypothetical protein
MKTLLTLCLLVLISGCSPLDKKYNNSTLTQDLKDIKDYGVSGSDTALLRFYIENKSFRKTDIQPNTTYKKLLELSRSAFTSRVLNDIKANDEVSLKKSLEQAKTDSMRNIISVSLFSKDYNDNGFKESIQMKFNLHNNGEKDIRAFKGEIIFKDVFGDILKKYNMECDVLIAAHQAIVYNAQIKYDQLLDSDVKLLNSDISDIQFVFDPKLILFDDGSKMTL